MLTVLRYTSADILNENISDYGAVSTTDQCFSLSLISYGIKAEWAFHMRSFPTSNECDFKCVLANLRGNEAGVYTANKPSTSKMLPRMSFHSRARPHPHSLPLLRGCTSPPGVLRVHLYSTSFTCREKCGNVELSKGLWKRRRADKFSSRQIQICYWGW